MSSAAIAANPARLRTLLGAVALLSGGGFALAFATAGANVFTKETLIGALVLISLATLTERLAVEERTFNVSIGCVFTVSVAVLYGPLVAGVGGLALALATARRMHPWQDRLIFNASNLTLACVAAGFAADGVGAKTDSKVVATAAAALVAANVFQAINYLLVAAVIHLEEGVPLREQVRTLAGVGVAPLAVSLSVVPLFVLEWQRSPAVAVAAMLPLVLLASRLRTVERGRVSAQKLALTDDLTDLGNRRRFFADLQNAVESAERTSEAVVLCLFDLDSFKRVNDTYGHAAGDDLLVAVAQALRHDGEAFRLGGDEFALLLLRDEAGRAAEVATAVQVRISALDGFGTTATFGLATYPVDGTTADQLLRAADRDLYRNKRERHATALA